MTRRVEFEPTIENRLHTYRYVRVEGPFEKSWPGLHGDTTADAGTSDDRDDWADVDLDELADQAAELISDTAA